MPTDRRSIRPILVTLVATAVLLVGAACVSRLAPARELSAAVSPEAEALPGLYEAGPYVIHHEDLAFDARAHGKLLLQARDNFLQTLTVAGLPLHNPVEPMPWLVYGDRAGFLEHEARVRGITRNDSAGGYYSSRRNEVVVFESDASDHTPRMLHEAAHQLAFNTGLQRRDVAYPFWFAEGLATNFEAPGADAPFGPTTDNPRREHAVQYGFYRDQLMPLSRFVCLDQLQTADPRKRAILYGQAWALFRYLFTVNRAGVERYVAAMQHEPSGRPTPAEHRRRFEAAFGDLASVAAGFDAYVSGL